MGSRSASPEGAPSLARPPLARAFGLAALCAALLAACSPAPTGKSEAPLVLTARADSGSADLTTTYAGEVRARFETPLSFRIAGKLVRRVARLGDEVKAGTLLAEIDPGDADAALAVAGAAVRASEKRLELARRTRERNSREASEDLVSRADMEQADSALAVAEADLDQARAQLDLAHNQARYTHLIADHDGLITSENAEVGSVLPAGQPVFGFAYAGERDAVIDVPEERIASVAPGQMAQVTLVAGAATAQTARVRELAKAADRDSRTFRVKLALSNPSAVRPGMTVTVTLAGAPGPSLVRIPAAALFHSGAEPAVWLVRPADHVLELRPVSIARYRADQVELSSGLAPGDEIVARGVHSVTAGSTVRPTPERDASHS